MARGARGLEGLSSHQMARAGIKWIRGNLREGEGGGPGDIFGLFSLGFRVLFATKGGGTPPPW